MILRGSEAPPQLEAEVYDEPFDETPLAGPWPRYWARMLDLTIGIVILSFVVGMLWPAMFVGADNNFSAIALILIPIVMAIEAGVVSLVGATIGKAVAGIRIETIEHQRPSFGTMVVRNLRCWVFGLALGIPIVTIGTMINNHGKVRAGNPTPWDEEGDTRVIATGSNLGRTFAAAILYVLVLAGAFAFGAMKPSAHAELLAEIPEMNQGLPRALDSATMLNRISLDASTIIYDYTLTNSDGSTMPTDAAQGIAPRFSTLEETNKASLCANRATNLLGRGVAMRYRYSAQGGVVVDYTVTPGECS